VAGGTYAEREEALTSLEDVDEVAES